MRVLLRVDASLEIGSGHFARCKVLADSLASRQSAHCIFIGRDPDGIMISGLANTAHTLRVLPEPSNPHSDGDLAHSDWLKRTQVDDLEVCRNLAGDTWRSDWLVIDHYGIDERWERCFPGRILVIDDLADRDHSADMLLDQNLRSVPWRDYSGRLRRGIRLLSGPRYALLRPEFHQLDEGIRNTDLFISFGGADAKNHTVHTLRVLAQLSAVTSHVAVPSRHPALSELKALTETMPGCRLHIDHSDLALLMRSSRLAIGAGGGMAWERCACGLPTLAWPVADNQRAQLLELAKTGALEIIPEQSCKNATSLARLVRELLDNEPQLETMSTAARRVCDGQGVHRVLRAMRANEIALRPAIADDSRRIFEWRNHPDVRRTAFNTDEIKPEEHERWFAASLANPDRVMRVAEFETRPVGFLRFDRKVNLTKSAAANAAEVSIFLAPGEQGSGVGSALLHKAEREIPLGWNIEILHAGIRADNDTSVRLFENAGYVKHSDGWQKMLPPTGSKQ